VFDPIVHGYRSVVLILLVNLASFCQMRARCGKTGWPAKFSGSRSAAVSLFDFADEFGFVLPKRHTVAFNPCFAGQVGKPAK
jgi:hypothetical protein